MSGTQFRTIGRMPSCRRLAFDRAVAYSTFTSKGGRTNLMLWLALLAALSACGGGRSAGTHLDGSTVAGAVSTSATNEPVSTSTTNVLAAFDVTVTDYVLRFNNLEKVVLELSGTVVQKLTVTLAGPGLFGNNVAPGNGIFVVAEGRSDKVRAAVVTAPFSNGHADTPARVLLAACQALFDTDQGLKVPDAFTRDAVPKLSALSTGSAISVGGMFDIRIAVDGTTIGFVCVPPGSSIPAAARNLPRI